jgi:cytochrome c-type biogenesis protein CcmH
VTSRRLALLALIVATAIAGTAGTATAKTSYLSVVAAFLCVVCHEPLSVSQSPEAFQERQYIRQLIAEGKTRQEIENDMVGQYGPAVLARPPAHGVNLLVYIIPPVLLMVGIAILAVFLPRWRRRARESGPSPAPTRAALDDADVKRLNEDLGRFA